MTNETENMNHDSDVPTMPDPTKNNPGGGPHVPTMPDPLNDPERGQKLPSEPDPSNQPPDINDPLPHLEEPGNNEDYKKIA